MKKELGKRILAWMLVFAMLWQSTGVETLAASVTASDGVETLTEENTEENTTTTSDDTKVEDSTSKDTDSGSQQPEETAQPDQTVKPEGTVSPDKTSDAGENASQNPKTEETVITEEITDEITADTFSTDTDIPDNVVDVSDDVVILNGIKDGTTTNIKTWTEKELGTQNPLEAAEEEIAKNEYSSYEVRILENLTVSSYTQTADRSNTTLYLQGHTLTVKPTDGSFGTYTVNVEGISDDDKNTKGTIAFDASEASAQSPVVTIGAQPAENADAVYISWKNTDIEVKSGDTASADTASLTVKLGQHNDVTWNEVSVPNDTAIETDKNSELTVKNTDNLTTGAVKVADWSSFYVKNEWKAASVALAKYSYAGAKKMDIDSVVLLGGTVDASLAAQENSTIGQISLSEGADVDHFSLIAQGEANASTEWPVFTINSTISDFKIEFEREEIASDGNDRTAVGFTEETKVAVLGSGLLDQISSEEKNITAYFDNDSVDFKLDTKTGALTAVPKPEDRSKLYWIYKTGDTDTYETGVDTLAEAKTWINTQQADDSSYAIKVNTTLLSEGEKTVTAGKDDLDYREEEIPVTLDLNGQTMTLTDVDTVITTSLQNGTLQIAKAGSITVYPDDREVTWTSLTVDMKSLSEKLTVGDQSRTYSGRLATESVNWENTGKLAVTMAGNADLTGETLNCASLKIVGDNKNQEVSIGTLKVTGNLELNGVLTVHLLENVGGTLTAVSGSTLTLTESGEINNLLVKGSGSEREERETFYLQLASPDGEETSEYALRINGTVSRSGKMLSPVTWRKVTYTKETGAWSVTPFGSESNSYQIYMPNVRSALDGFFTSDKYDDTQDDYICVVCEKTGTGYGVAAKKAKVFVKHGNATKRFESFEKAVAGISKPLTSGGFGNDKGAYTFVILASECLSNNVTLPACVTDLSITTNNDDEKHLNSGSAHGLNLEQGKAKDILKTTATEIYISPFVDLRNGTLEAPNAVSIRMDRFSEYNLTGSDSDQWSGKGDDLTINAPNAVFTAKARTWSEGKHQATDDAVFDMSETTLNVASVVSSSADKNGNNPSSTVKPEVQFKKLTLNSGTTTFTGKTTIPTLVQQGGSVDVEEGASVEVTTWNVTRAGAKDTVSGSETIHNDGGQLTVDTLNMTVGTLYNGGKASAVITNVKRLKKLVNDGEAAFHVHTYASVNGDTVWLKDTSLFAVDAKSVGEDQEEESGSVVLYGLQIAGTPVIQKSLSDTLTVNGTPAQTDSESRCTIKIYEPDQAADALLGKVAFNTSMSSGFPLEMFNIVATIRGEDAVDEARASEDFMLRQSGRQILIAKALFSVYQAGIDDDDDDLIGTYADWQQAAAAINNINNAANKYKIKVLDDGVTIDGTFTLPSRAAELDFVYETNSDELCTLTWYGNLSLPVNVTFENFWLTPKVTAREGASASNIALNQKTLYLKDSGGVFANVTGSGTSVWKITSGDGASIPVEEQQSTTPWVAVTGSVSGIGNLYLQYAPGSSAPTLQVTNNVTATKLTLEDAAWLQTKGVRNTKGQMTTGKITVTNVITNGSKNKISYPGENAASMLYVNGKVDTDPEYTKNYGYGNKIDEYSMGYAIIADTTGMTNAKDECQLLSARNVSSSWFVTETSTTPEGGTATVSYHWTVKSGDWIIAADEDAPSVELYRTESGEIDGEEFYGCYGTVKEAFSQIQNLNDSTMSYEVVLLSPDATNVNENLTFPSRAKNLTVRNDSGENQKFCFKNVIELNCSTTFCYVDFQTSAAGGQFKVKNFALSLKSCTISENSKITGIVGSGRGQVTLENSSSQVDESEETLFTVNGTVSGLENLIIERENSASEGLHVTGHLTVTELELTNASSRSTGGSELDNPLLEVDGKLNVTNIEAKADSSRKAAVQVTATLTRNTRSTQKEITKVVPNFTINGTVSGDTLYITMAELVKDGSTTAARTISLADDDNYVWGSTYKTTVGDSTVYKNIPLALAKKAMTDGLALNGAAEGSLLYKSGGYITYMSTDEHALEVSYEIPVEEGISTYMTPCLTWADAIAEISNQAAGNSQAKERDYVITLLTDLGSAEDTAAPISLSMPGRNTANSITVTSSASETKTIYYQGNITANTGLNLSQVNLKKKVKVSGKWAEAAFDADSKSYAAPVTLTMAGAYMLDIGDAVTFNTPLLLKGNNAGILKLSATAGKTLKTEGNRTDITTTDNLIYGSVTGFAYVDLNNEYGATGSLRVEKYVTGTDRNNHWVYTDGALTVAKDLTLDGASLRAASITVSGNVKMTDSKVQSAGVFTLNKDLTYTGDNTLTTVRKSTADLTPYLTVKGTVTHDSTGESTGNSVAKGGSSADDRQITVQVLAADGSEESAPILAVAEETFTANQIASCRRLLVAPKADTGLFKPAEANLESTNKDPYKTGATTGYILWKDRSGYVNVYYQDEIQAAVYAYDSNAATNAGGELLGYYVTWADAVAAVSGYKTADPANTMLNIVLCNPVGSADAPVNLTMPSTKATVVICSDTYNSQRVIYYNNTISLRSNTVFNGITLEPTAVKTVKGKRIPYGVSRDIATGSYNLTMYRVSVEGVEGGNTNASIGNITGAGAKDAYYAFEGNTTYELSGKLALTRGTVRIDGGTGVTAAGAVDIPTLAWNGSGRLEGKSSIKIGDIVSTSASEIPVIRTWRTATDRNGLDYSQLSITGHVYSGLDANGQPSGSDARTIRLVISKYGDKDNLISRADYALDYDRDANVRLTVPAAKKLADIKQEYVSYFVLTTANADGAPGAPETTPGTASGGQGYALMKYAGGLYVTSTAGSIMKDYAVLLQNGTRTSYCLDLNQAATEIANLAASDEGYNVSSWHDVTDTCITDAAAVSSLALPTAGKAREVVYSSDKKTSTSDDTEVAITQPITVRLLASGGIRPAGNVAFDNITFDPVDAKGNPANVALSMSTSAVTGADGKKTNVSNVTLENCTMKDNATMFASVTGVRNLSSLTLTGSTMGVLGTMQSVDELKLCAGAGLTTLGTVNVNKVTINDSGDNTDSEKSTPVTWNAWGTTTINTELFAGMRAAGSYVGTRRDARTEKSYFTLNGAASVPEQGSTEASLRIWMKVMKDTTTLADIQAAYKKETFGAAGLYRTGTESDADTCKDISLLVAPKADAGIFWADAYRDQNTSNTQIASYKDLNYNVKNGNMREMAVQIRCLDRDEGTADATTYAKTFAQAVTLINRAGSGVKAADYDSYEIMLLTENLEKDDNQLILKTAQDSNQKAAYGALTLPSCARELTITTDSNYESENIVEIRFTGAITPRCNTTFERVKLVSGSLSRGDWLPEKATAPAISMGNTGWTLTLPAGSTGDTSTQTYASVIAPLAELVLPANTDVTVNSTLSVKNLKVGGSLNVKGTLNATTLTALSADAQVTGEKTITLTNLDRPEDTSATNQALKLTTYRTARASNRISRTQLTIGGNISVPTNLQMMVYEKDKINGTLEDTHAFNASDVAAYRLGEDNTPTDDVKLAVMPKASLDRVTLLVAGKDTAYDKDLSLWKYEKGVYLAADKYAVSKGGLPVVVTASKDGTEIYQASFMNWTQAVKEIDTIADKTREYTIELSENQGDNASIGTLTMPYYAAKLTVKSNDDHGRYVFFTGTAITLRCPTEFERIGLISVVRKASGKSVWYESRAYSINAGNYDLTIKNMLEGGNFAYKVNNDNQYAYLETSVSRLAGNTKSTLTWEMTTGWSDTSGTSYMVANMNTAPADQITGFGTVDLKTTSDFDHKVGATTKAVESKAAVLSVLKGVSGIGSLNISEDVTLNVTQGSTVVKDAMIRGRINTRNYTSTGITTMYLGVIDAGMWVKNTVTGAVKLNQLKLGTLDNQIIGRRNRSNVSQIVISGAVTQTDDYKSDKSSQDLVSHAPVVICLTEYARNANAQLANGMVLLQAPKVTQDEANEIFAPKYSGYNYDCSKNIQGMGQKKKNMVVTIKKPVRTNNLTWNYELSQAQPLT